MKVNENKLYLKAVLLILSGSLTWILTSCSLDLASDEELRQAYGEDLLFPSERELLDKSLLHSRKNVQSNVAALVAENRFTIQRIIDKLVKRALYLRIKSKEDSAAHKIELASELASVYSKNLGDEFFERNVAFCDSLKGRSIQLKLTADLYFTKASYAHSKDDFKTVLYFYQKSLEICQRIGDRSQEVDNLIKIQHVYYAQSLYEMALQIGSETSEKANRIGYLRRKISVYYTNGLINIELGDAKTALQNFEAGLILAKETNDLVYQMMLYGKIGNANRRLGQFSQAFEAHNNALAFCKKLGNKREELVVLNDRSLVYRDKGNYSKALADLNTALQLAVELNAYNKISIMLNMGEINRILGDYEQALRNINDAFKYSSDPIRRYDMSRLLGAKGSIFRDQKLYDKAEDSYQEGLRIIAKDIVKTTNIKPRTLEAELRLRLGDIYIQEKKWDVAYKECQKALNAFTQLAYQKEIVHARTRMGHIFRETADFERALEHLKIGANIAEELEDPLLLSNAYYGIAAVMKDKREYEAAEKYLQLAIQEIEATRVRIVGNEKITYFATWQDIYDEMIQLQYNNSNYAKAFTYSELSRARAFRELFEENQEYRPVSGAKGNTHFLLSDFQKGLDENIQLIEYKVIEDSLLTYVVDHENIRANADSISRERLTRLVSDFREAIGADNDSVFIEAVSKDPKKTFDNSMTIAAELYNILIDPIKDIILPEKIIYFIPDDALFYLPFAALATKEENGYRFLIEDYTVAYSPSASVLDYHLSTNRPTIPPKTMRFIGIGNPTGELDKSEKEVKTIAKMFVSADILVGNQTSERNVVAALNENYNVVHLATHAIINEKSPLSSYLIFADNEKNGKHTAPLQSLTNGQHLYDGVLTAQEAFSLNLSNARLVNLAACKTASGRLYRGEGIVGINRAFMKAGTSTIINSLWNVDDHYTQKLMLAFYRNWLTGDVNKAEALRKAQLQIIANMRSDKIVANAPLPYAWAPFILTGEY